MENKRLNSRQLAEIMDVTAKTICKWIKTRGLPARKVNRQWTFDPDLLKEWKRAQQPALPSQSGEELTSKEAALILHKTPETVAQWAKAGRLPARKTPRGWRFLKEAVQACLVESRGAANAGRPGAAPLPSREKSKYARGFSAGALMLVQSVEAALLKEEGASWDDVISRALTLDLFQTRSAATNRRYCFEVVNRLAGLSEEELELLRSGAPSDQKNILWLALCRRYRFIADFGADVLFRRYNDMKPDLQPEHYESYFEEQSLVHPELKKLSPASREKLRANLFKIMREAGYLDADNQLSGASVDERFAGTLESGRRIGLRSLPIRESQLKELIR